MFFTFALFIFTICIIIATIIRHLYYIDISQKVSVPPKQNVFILNNFFSVKTFQQIKNILLKNNLNNKTRSSNPLRNGASISHLE